jgi:hypothetical protein
MAEQTRQRGDVPQREDDNSRAEPSRPEKDGPPPNVLRDKGVEPAEDARREIREEGT